MTGIAIRRITKKELNEFFHVMWLPFGIFPTSEMTNRIEALCNPSRHYAAFDEGKIVSTIGSFKLNMTVPGGTVLGAGSWMASTIPTYRCRGIFAKLMTKHLDEMYQRNELLSAGWASDGEIHARFGYSSACDYTSIAIPKEFAYMKEPVDVSSTIKIVNETEASIIFPRIFSEAISQRSGMFSRDHNRWEYHMQSDSETLNQGVSPYQRAIHIGESSPDGYVVYVTHHHKEDYYMDVEVLELVAVDSAVEKSLWQYIFNIGLVRTIISKCRPVDDSLIWWLKNPSKIKRTFYNGMIIRLTNVQEALNSRRYSASGSVVFRCVDPIFSWNNGIYCLRVDSNGVGECAKSNGTPEIELSVRNLASVYLSGHTFGEIARGGEIIGSKEVIKRLDRMFFWDSLPWCFEKF